MQISIINPGLLSTVQDLGRRQYLSQGVPVSGAMDTLSARIANKAVGNDDNCAVIEFTCSGKISFEANTDILIAYSGGGAILQVENRNLPTDKPIFIPVKTVLDFVKVGNGSRIYLAVAGGWDVPEVLGSKSTYLTAAFGGFRGRALRREDVLRSAQKLSLLSQKIFGSLKGTVVNYPKWGIARHLLLKDHPQNIRVVPAHEFTWFTGRSIIDFLSSPYQLSLRSNRMGCHLEGTLINRVRKEELLSTAVAPGTIQVTGNGSLVLLLADCQTTGGYPRIAQVAAVDLPLCGQLSPGDVVFFKEISRHDAEMLYLEREQYLKRLTEAICNKFCD